MIGRIKGISHKVKNTCCLGEAVRNLRNIKKLAISVGFHSDTEKRANLKIQNQRQSF